MTNRIIDLKDLSDRLINKTSVGARVYPSRAWAVPEKKLPAILVYAMIEDGRPVSVASHPQFKEITEFSIQVMVQEGPGWDTQAMALTDKVKDILFTDPVWLARWKEVPAFRVQQFVDEKGSQNIAGEVMTLSVERSRPTEYKPAPALVSNLTGVDTTVDLNTGNVGDAIKLTQDTP